MINEAMGEAWLIVSMSSLLSSCASVIMNSRIVENKSIFSIPFSLNLNSMRYWTSFDPGMTRRVGVEVFMPNGCVLSARFSSAIVSLGSADELLDCASEGASSLLSTSPV